MSLSSLQLDAFTAVARLRNFSKAAKSLGLTQPALSQRILNLECDLETVLFVREPAGVRLTEKGEALLRYCQTREGLERELLGDWQASEQSKLGGHIRIAGFSTVMRSVIFPALAELVRSNRAVTLETKVRELSELPGLLRRGEVDFVVLDQEIKRAELKAHFLGFETNVLIESTRAGGAKSEVYLDHDADDETTRAFLRLNKISGQKITRCYLDEIYGIIDGVAEGLGRAVVPRHLIRQRRDLREVPGLRPLKVPVVLHYYAQAYLPRLSQAVIDTLTTHAPRHFDE